MKKLLLLLALLTLGGCTASPTTAKPSPDSAKVSKFELPDENGQCRTGFVISSGRSGEPICIPE